MSGGTSGLDHSMEARVFGSDDLLPVIRRSERDLFTADEVGVLETPWIAAARIGCSAELVERAVRWVRSRSSAGEGLTIAAHTATSCDTPT